MGQDLESQNKTLNKKIIEFPGWSNKTRNNAQFTDYEYECSF